MEKTRYYRVKTGYGADEFISITEAELQKAVRAQVNGGIVIFEGGSVAGNAIMTITPDYNKAMGFKSDYKLTGEDFDRLGGDAVKSHRDALLIASSRARVARTAGSIEHRLDNGQDKIVDSLTKNLTDGTYGKGI